MTDIIRTKGIKKRMMDDLRELNGFHELTRRDIGFVTEPEWKSIVSKHYPIMDLENRTVHVDLDSEMIVLE